MAELKPLKATHLPLLFLFLNKMPGFVLSSRSFLFLIIKKKKKYFYKPFGDTATQT